MLGLARGAGPTKRHVVVSRVEHAAVREAARRLESEGFEITWVGVDRNGLVDPAEFDDSLRPDTALAAVVWANNEVGTVEPIAELARLCADRGVPSARRRGPGGRQDPARRQRSAGGHARPLRSQVLRPAGRWRPVRTKRGSVGADALWRRAGSVASGAARPTSLAWSASAWRPGWHATSWRTRTIHETSLRDRILEGCGSIPGVTLNGHPLRRLSNNAHLSVDGVEAEGLVLFLDSLGYAVGSGSACASGAAGHKASPVLLAMGRDDREAFSSVRITVGKDNTMAEIEGFLEAFAGAVSRLRRALPAVRGLSADGRPLQAAGAGPPRCARATRASAPHPSGLGESGDAACGDVARFTVRIEDNALVDVRYKVYGCAACIAAGSALAEGVHGGSLLGRPASRGTTSWRCLAVRYRAARSTR